MCWKAVRETRCRGTNWDWSDAQVSELVGKWRPTGERIRDGGGNVVEGWMDKNGNTSNQGVVWDKGKSLPSVGYSSSNGAAISYLVLVRGCGYNSRGGSPADEAVNTSSSSRGPSCAPLMPRLTHPPVPTGAVPVSPRAALRAGEAFA